jgi:hypothetical protein
MLCSSVAFMYHLLFFSQNIFWLEAEGTGVLILIILSPARPGFTLLDASLRTCMHCANI